MKFWVKIGSKKINFKSFCSCCSSDKTEIEDKESGDIVIKSEDKGCPNLATTVATAVVKAAVVTAITLV